MKILIVSDVFPPGAGGSGESSAALASALQRRGHDPWVLTLTKDSRTSGSNVNEDQTRDWGRVRVRRVYRGAKRQAVERLARAVREICETESVDVVHAQHWRSMEASVAASSGVPIVVTIRDYWPVCQWSTKLAGHQACPGCTYWRRMRCVTANRPALWALAPLLPFVPPVISSQLARRRHLLNEASAVVAVSRHVASSLGSLDSEVQTVPNMLELDRIRRSIDTELIDVPDRFVLFIGKLEPNKAADRVVPIVRRSGVRLPVLIAGEGRLESRIREQALESGLDVRMLGWVDAERLRAMTARAEVIVFPSRWEEPLSRVLLEALGVGACVLAEPTGGTEDIIEHEVSGLLAAGDAAMSTELARLCENPNLRRALRKGALAKAQVFSSEIVVPRVEAIYAAVLGQSPPRRR